MEKLMVCHHECHHDGLCHRSCPRPHNQFLQEKLEMSMACHRACSEASCHHQCPCPFAEMKEKCFILGQEVGSWKLITSAVTV